MEEFFKWYWIIFSVPFAFGIILAIGAAIGMGADDGDPDIDGDADNTSFKMLSLLGIGKVPLTFVITSMALVFGGTGLILNKTIGTGFIIFSVPIAFVVMVVFTRVISGLIAKIMPQTETYIITDENLIGKIGKITIKTDKDFGQVHVQDDGGTIHSLKCRTTFGEELSIGTKVLVIDKEDGFYVVEPAPEEI